MKRMDRETINSIITRSYQLNGLLELVEKNKYNQDITLGEIYKKFERRFLEHPGSDDYSFLNQHYFLCSLFAHICLIAESSKKIFGDKKVIEFEEEYDFSLGLNNKNLLLYTFVRDLRNAISHTRVNITPKLVCEFSRDGKSIDYKINYKKLMDFIHALNMFFVAGRPLRD